MTHAKQAGSYLVAGTLAAALLALPALVSAQNVRVVNNNHATVVNTTSASANTGDNVAGGAAGGDGGRGGDVRSNDDADDNTTGSGGSGGSAGPGGYVATGAAYADALTDNRVNINRTTVDDCACEGDRGEGDVVVRNNNWAYLTNHTGASANSGRNTAHGSRGGDGGRGGDVSGNDDADGNTTGSGGSGGSAGPGGTVLTGPASSYSTTFNVVNRNITRVLR